MKKEKKDNRIITQPLNERMPFTMIGSIFMIIFSPPIRRWEKILKIGDLVKVTAYDEEFDTISFCKLYKSVKEESKWRENLELSTEGFMIMVAHGAKPRPYRRKPSNCIQCGSSEEVTMILVYNLKIRRDTIVDLCRKCRMKIYHSKVKQKKREGK